MRALAVGMAAEETRGEEHPFLGVLLGLSGRAFQVAARIVDSDDEARDVVQQACLNALRWPPDPRPEAEVRAWFLSVVVNAARKHVRSRGRRRRREAAMEPRAGAGPGDAGRAEMVSALRAALAALDEKYRLPLALCCEQELSRREAAAVLKMPVSTLSKYVNEGLDRLRRALARAGYAALPAAVLGGLRQTAPLVPSSLGAAVEKIVAGQAAAQAGSGAGSMASGAALAAKGGIAMKVVAGVVAAGTLAGAVAVSTGDLFSMGGGDGEPAPVNPYNGTQDREEVYEFTQKPKVSKQGDKWVITFASKGKCDATVAIVGPDGKVVRHLASGVLGKNAPHPFQQNSLSQKLEWDGLKDDFSKADAAGCKVRVSLGLKAEFDRNIVWDPYSIPTGISPPGAKYRSPESRGCLLAAGKDGVRYVGGRNGSYWCTGRAYDKDGKYLYTFFPPSAAKLEEFAKLLPQKKFSFTSTVWGDRALLVPGNNGFTPGMASFYGKASKDPLGGTLLNLATAVKAQPDAGEIKIVTLASVGLPAHKPVTGTASKNNPGASAADYFGNSPRMAVDRVREELYLLRPGGLHRLDGRTGERDTSWFGGGLGTSWLGRQVGEVAVGPDGCIYMRTGPFYYGHWLFRLDHDGKPVPFKHNAEDVEAAAKKWGLGHPPIKGLTAIYTGQSERQSNGHEKGLHVALNGNIVVPVNVNPGEKSKSHEWMKKHGLVNPDGKLPARGGRVVVVWDKDGKLLSPNAVYYTSGSGQGVHMDRDGNIYRHETAATAACKGRPAGLADSAPEMRSCSSLVKYRGRGGDYPIGTGPEAPQKKGKWNANPWILPEPTGLTDSIELVGRRSHPTKGGPVKCLGALWAYPGLWTEPGCTCSNLRHDLDDYARTWVPSPHLFSVVVLDANGNRIARIGRYGNADDADEKCGKIHLAWPSAAAASDEALYVMDNGDFRLLRCRLGYHAEETVGLDGSASASVPTRAPAAAPAARALEAKPAVVTKQDAPAAAPAPAAGAASGVGSGPDPAVACRGWWSLAMSYKRAGRKDKAREYLRRIIAQHPDTDYAARARREIAQL